MLCIRPNIPKYSPSLRDVSVHYGLNYKQHKAFFRVGKHLLTSFVQDSKECSHMIGYLGGLPGAGKSQVIKAIQKLSQLWQRADNVATIAYQGVAAQSAGGQTIHKLFGFRINSSLNNLKSNLLQTERLCKLKLLIIDEISTCDVKFLGMIDQALKQVRQQPDKPFGGVHVLLVGDWLQQLPVAGQPAYISEPQYSTHSRSREESDSSVYFNRIAGIEVYKLINSVIMLNENMRHRHDPTWRDILNRWRFGLHLNDDIDVINRCCYRENWSSERVELKTFCPIIVISNTLRAEFNDSCTKSYCRRTGEVLHQFPAIVTRSRFALSKSEINSLKSLRDDKSGNTAILLSVANGILLQCTKNISANLQLANGSIGYMTGFTPDPKDTVQTKSCDGSTYQRHSNPPTAIYIRLLGSDGRQFIPSLPANIVPVRCQTYHGVKVALPARSFTISITQCPVIPAFSQKNRKISRFDRRKDVTRVKSLNNLFLMEPLTKEYLNFFKPRADIIEENARLEALERISDK